MTDRYETPLGSRYASNEMLALFSQDRRITRELLEKVFAGLPEVSVFALLDAISERKAQFKLELDVRGERVNDAIEIVMRYIDDAIMLGVPSVRILHGKGTGALREEIQKYVRTVPGVTSAADEHIQLGGSGVTVVKFD